MSSPASASSQQPLRLTAVGLGAAALLALAYVVGTAHGGGARALAAAAPAAGATEGPSVSVDGTGHIAGTPDVLKLDLGVEGRAATVSAALDAASAALTKVRDSLRAHAVAPADLQTSQLSVQPNYDYPNGRQQLRGYVAAESLTVRLHRLASAGRTITDTVAAGGSAVRVNGIALDIDSDAALVARARDRAFAAAKAKAEQYARLSGRPLGAVIRVTERVTGALPKELALNAAARADTSVPVEPGSAEVTVTVAVDWALR